MMVIEDIHDKLTSQEFRNDLCDEELYDRIRRMIVCRMSGIYMS